MDFAIILSSEYQLPVLVYRDTNEDGECIVVVKCYSRQGYDFEEYHRMHNESAAQHYVADFSAESANRVAGEAIKLDLES